MNWAAEIRHSVYPKAVSEGKENTNSFGEIALEKINSWPDI